MVEKQCTQLGERAAKWFFNILWVSLFLYGVYALVCEKDAAIAGVAFAGGALCFVLSNIRDFKNIAAFGFQAERLEQRADEVEGIYQQVQNVAQVLTKATLATIQSSGRRGGFPANEGRELFEDLQGMLSGLNITEKEKAEIERLWHHYVHFDYTHVVLGGNTTPEGGTDAEIHEWKELRRRFDNPASPDELEDFLTRGNFMTNERRELLEDFRYYMQHHKHCRPDVFKKVQSDPNNRLRKIGDEK